MLMRVMRSSTSAAAAAFHDDDDERDDGRTGQRDTKGQCDFFV